MNKEIFFELKFFVASFFLGFQILLIYDIIDIIRGYFKSKIVVIHYLTSLLTDLLFWAAAAVAVFLLMYEMNYGIVRSFAVLAGFLGMLTYKGTATLVGRKVKKNAGRRKKRKKEKNNT